MTKLITFLILLSFNSSAIAEEYFSYNKIESYDKKTKVSTGVIIQFDNKVEVKSILTYSLDGEYKGFTIETKIPIGRKQHERQMP